MNDPQEMIAEADRLTAEGRRLVAQATEEARAAGLLDSRNSYLTCAAAEPLLQQAKELRRAAARATSARRAAAPTPAALSRAEKFALYGEGLGLDQARIDEAVASGIEFEQFAVAEARRVTQERERDRVAAGIAAFIPKARRGWPTEALPRKPGTAGPTAGRGDDQ